MVEAERIADPSLLQQSDIVIRLSSLSLGTSEPSSESSSQTQHVKLVLLQPLANADMLEACRDPDSRLVCKPNGFVCGVANHEYLDIQPLSKAWRQALTKVPPISQLTFDLALPKKDETSKGSFQRVYWGTAMPQEESLGVHARDVRILAITIATVMRMRADGDVRFEVTYDETEGVLPGEMAYLKKQLLALAETKAPRVKDGDQGTKMMAV